MGVESVILGSGRKPTLGKGWEEAWTVIGLSRFLN